MISSSAQQAIRVRRRGCRVPCIFFIGYVVCLAAPGNRTRRYRGQGLPTPVYSGLPSEAMRLTSFSRLSMGATSMSQGATNSGLRAQAARWRDSNSGVSGGVVLIWEGAVYGWKDCLRDPRSERPGAYAVDEAGRVFVAAGGNEYDGAAGWVVCDCPA